MANDKFKKEFNWLPEDEQAALWAELLAVEDQSDDDNNSCPLKGL